MIIPTKDDVERLSNGKPTKTRVGSRATPHRLTIQERKQLGIAKKRGFLTLKYNQRENLLNIWYTYCQSMNIPYLLQYQGNKEKQDMIVSLIDPSNTIAKKYPVKKVGNNFRITGLDRSEAKGVLKSLVGK